MIQTRSQGPLLLDPGNEVDNNRLIGWMKDHRVTNHGIEGSKIASILVFVVQVHHATWPIENGGAMERQFQIARHCYNKVKVKVNFI